MPAACSPSRSASAGPPRCPIAGRSRSPMSPDLSGRVRPTDKGLPAWASGLTPAEFAARRPNLADAGFLYPVLTADETALTANIQAMAGYVRQRGALLCPHGKTTMSPELIG